MTKNRLSTIQTVRFKRKSDSKEEFGVLMVRSSGDRVLDADGDVVDPVWDYTEVQGLCVDISAILRSLEKE